MGGHAPGVCLRQPPCAVSAPAATHGCGHAVPGRWPDPVVPRPSACKEVLSGPRLMYSQEGKAKGGLEGEVVELEGELAAVEERVRRLIHLIEEKMPLYKQVNCSSSVENVF